jgi:flagellar biosynthesis/type III secretory pathway protein FliH
VLLLREETIMHSWVYTQGKQKGLEEGRAEGVKEGRAEGVKEGRAESVKSVQRALRSLFERRTGRSPAPEEERALARRASEVTPEQLVELADLSADALAAWLLGPRNGS